MPELKIIGRRPAFEALEADLPVTKILLQDSADRNFANKIVHLAKSKRIQLKVVDKNTLHRLSEGENHQGILLYLPEVSAPTLQELLASIKNEKYPAVVLLDGIEDPHNFGAILRVADGAGIHGVIIPNRRSAKLSPGTIKASAGAALHVPVVEVTNLARAMDTLKEAGFWLVGAEMEGAKNVWELDFKMPTGFVLGREGQGLHRLIKEKCDFLTMLPMHGKVNSLNVSTAAAVVFYERVRQLGM
ncbi:MAG: 23S rRNA (guanosine(2251)-2'-O)-methyltransferase RlmB [Deferribacteres bacterium]|nr:23S rRNA (guanosine(2251)-2'-O)-methyltransferase RlmB [candidate division KSB1 bacterium]MCB9500952.1 23S rRNA (guanosine(2251)-2'-O)-methyltransferase RlmB [Deferribacteres bacterium]